MSLIVVDCLKIKRVKTRFKVSNRVVVSLLNPHLSKCFFKPNIADSYPQGYLVSEPLLHGTDALETSLEYRLQELNGTNFATITVTFSWKHMLYNK